MVNEDQLYSFYDTERYKHTMRGVMWPEVYPPDISRILALQYYFHQTEWSSPEELTALQFKQLDVLLKHTIQTVPYYKDKFKSGSAP